MSEKITAGNLDEVIQKNREIHEEIDITFVRIIGIWAGSISTLVAYFVLVVYRMIDVQKFQKIKFNLKRMMFSLLLLGVMAILNFQKVLLFDLINVAICAIVLFIFDRNIISDLFRKLTKKIFKKSNQISSNNR